MQYVRLEEPGRNNSVATEPRHRWGKAGEGSSGETGIRKMSVFWSTDASGFCGLEYHYFFSDPFEHTAVVYGMLTTTEQGCAHTCISYTAMVVGEAPKVLYASSCA